MADTKRTIEILLQIKQQGQEALTNLSKAIDAISEPLQEAKKSFDELGASSEAAADGVKESLDGIAGATEQVAEGVKDVGDSAAEPLEKLKDRLKQVVPPVQQVGTAVKGMETDAKKSIDGTVTKFGGFRPAANAALASVRSFASGARSALAGIEVAAEAAWAAITFGASAVLKALSFLNPFSVRGLLTGAAWAMPSAASSDSTTADSSPDPDPTSTRCRRCSRQASSSSAAIICGCRGWRRWLSICRRGCQGCGEP